MRSSNQLLERPRGQLARSRIARSYALRPLQLVVARLLRRGAATVKTPSGGVVRRYEASGSLAKRMPARCRCARTMKAHKLLNGHRQRPHGHLVLFADRLAEALFSRQVICDPARYWRRPVPFGLLFGSKPDKFDSLQVAADSLRFSRQARSDLWIDLRLFRLRWVSGHETPLVPIYW